MTARRRDAMSPPTRVYGRITIKEPSKPEALPEGEAATELVKLFDRAMAARNIDKGIDSGQYKGMPRPRRCTTPVRDGRTCDLPLLHAESHGCTYHRDSDRFGALGFDKSDIFDGTPHEAEIRAKAAKLRL